MTHRTALFSLVSLALIGCEDSSATSTDDLSEILATLDAQTTLIAELQSEHDAMANELLALEATDTELTYDLVALLDEVAALSGGVDLTELMAAIGENELAITTLDAEHDQFVTEAWVGLQGFADADMVSTNTDMVSANTGSIATIAADYLTSTALSGYATEGWVSGQSYATSADVSTLSSSVSTNASDIAAIQVDYVLSSDLSAIDDRVSDIESDYLVAADIADFADDADLTAVSDRVSGIESDYLEAADIADFADDADLIAVSDRVSGIESDYLVSTDLTGYATQSWVSGRGYVEDLSDYVSVDTSSNEVIISGANVFVQSGSGYTDDNTTGVLGDASGSITGLGNLILGYDEIVGLDDKMGAHNLVIGFGHSYSNFGGLISGYNNEMDAPAGAVLGGQSNAVFSDFAVVVGGYNNAADATYSVVSGGYYNDATGDYSVVSGGYYNEASGDYSVIGGGSYNEASGSYSVVSAGYYNDASGSKSAVSGGSYNDASGTESAVSGGKANTASHSNSVAGGGFGTTTSNQYDFAY